MGIAASAGFSSCSVPRAGGKVRAGDGVMSSDFLVVAGLVALVLPSCFVRVALDFFGDIVVFPSVVVGGSVGLSGASVEERRLLVEETAAAREEGWKFMVAVAG